MWRGNPVPRLDKSLLNKIHRELAAQALRGQSLQVQAIVWRAVLHHAPMLSAEETASCAWQILTELKLVPKRLLPAAA